MMAAINSATIPPSIGSGGGVGTGGGGGVEFANPTLKVIMETAKKTVVKTVFGTNFIGRKSK